MWNEIRYALRSLRQNPGFALTAIVSIALGIGANAAIFSFTDGLLTRPLPVRDPSRVATLRARTPGGGFGDLSYADFADLRDRSQSFAGMAAYDLAAFGFARDAKSAAQLKVGFFVNAGFFRALGVEPRIGRGFGPEEDRVPPENPAVVLSHGFWQTEFGGDPGIVGRRVRLGGLDFTVIGVTSESFTGLDQYIRPEFFVPAGSAEQLGAENRDLLTDRSRRAFRVKGRLKPGVTIAAADAEVAAIAHALAETHPETNRDFGAAVRTEWQARTETDTVTPVLLALLFALVAVVLGIACANVANLMLTRGQARSREIAVRLAIGASRSRLVRQLMAESLLIALAGGSIGLGIAGYASRVFAILQVPGDVPIQFDFSLDQRVLWFTFLVSVATATLVGLAPALQSTKADLVNALKAGDIRPGRKKLSGRNALIVAQAAGSLVLLVAAAQLYQVFSRALAASPGFRIDHRITMRFDPSLIGYTPAQTAQFYKRVVERAREVPGVQSAGLTYATPMTSDWGPPEEVVPEGYQLPKGSKAVGVMTGIVDENYFAAFGVPLVSGRGFLPSDRSDSRPVAVVNESFARHYLGDNPIGKRLRRGGGKGDWVEVVGITVTGKYFSLLEPPIDFLYLPLSQNPQPRMTLIVASQGAPAALAGPLREMVRSIDPNLPVFGVRTMGDLFNQRSTRVLHLVNYIVGLIGLGGLGLALVGLYAVTAYRAALARREIGIRMALGADRRQVLRMFLQRAVVLSLIGAAIGTPITYVFGKGLSSALVALGVRPFDPAALAGVTLAMVAAMLLAAWIPARHAARVDPMQALRQD